jgi:riboflavin biosynthesis pyrimidine reductase
MTKNLIRLFPTSCPQVAIKGLYLDHQIHQLGTSESPFVYANFLSSLDGRIALEDIVEGNSFVPKHLTSASDFGLFMELHAQADCLITHGGYLRALNHGHLGNILQVSNNDLQAWRHDHGLAPQPAVIIASASLDFPMHESLLNTSQAVYIATGENADRARVDYWQQQGFPVLFAGEDKLVQGAALIDELTGLGYRSIYLIAGPQMLDTMIREHQLSRLYLTISHQLLGGKDFRTLLTGEILGAEGNLTLESMFYEQNLPPEVGQFFMQFAARPQHREVKISN